MPHATKILQAVACLLCLATSVAAQWAIDPQVNNPVCTMTSTQSSPVSVSDGAGGVIVAWSDDRDTNSHIYAQRIGTEGEILWTSSGVRVCEYDSEQNDPQIVSDGAGGAIVVWEDYDNLFAQRLSSSGVYLWNWDGVAIINISGTQDDVSIAADGSGGVLVAWEDDRNGTDEVYAQRLDSSGTRLWESTGVLLCASVSIERNPQIAPDTGGGAIVCWEDTRNGYPMAHVYARRINYLGTPIWTTDGVYAATTSGDYTLQIDDIESDGDGGVFISFSSLPAIGDPPSNVRVQYLNAAGVPLWGEWGYLAFSTSSGIQDYSRMAPDGSGGVVIMCHDEYGSDDFDIKAQRLNAAGDYLWGLGGSTAMSASGPNVYGQIAGDGEGGAVVTWFDYRHNNASCYSQRFDSSGGRLWGDDGKAVTIGNYFGNFTEIPIPDEDGGFIVVWEDQRSANHDIYAQRLDGTGYPGEPSPTLSAVTDFPNDQGGLVEVGWSASYLDAAPWHAVETYALWMRPEDAKDTAAPIDDTAARALGLDPEDLAAFARAGWTYVGSALAMMTADYGMLAPTYGDSTAAGIVTSEYMVSGHGDDVWEIWQSDPLGGYSIDNIVPGAPLNLAGVYDVFGNVDLSWSGGPDGDLHHYAVYRGETSGFAVDAAHCIATSSAPNHEDPVGSGRWYYRVTAVDVHDGESAPSDEIMVNDATAVGDTPAVLALRGATPNPFNPCTEIRFDLPRDGAVTLGVHALDGRRVAVLFSGDLPAGTHTAVWDGRGEDGRPVASGTYVCRLIAAGEQRHLKLSLLK